MTHVTSDQLRDISVAVVEEFINHKTPLSAGLAKQASAYELNPDQIQRCVEASNTIAYLKLLGMAEDRTFEFPLCKFAEVMQHVATPDFEKSAGLWQGVKNTFKDVAGKGHAADVLKKAKKSVEDAKNLEGSGEKTVDRIRTQWAINDLKDAEQIEHKARRIAGARLVGGAVAGGALGTGGYLGYQHLKNKAGQEKTASVTEPQSPMSEHEQKVLLVKAASSNRAALTGLEGRAIILNDTIAELSHRIGKDPQGLDKIACVAEGADARALATMAYGSAQGLRDFGGGKDGLFKQAELKEVKTLADLYKEAKLVVAELRQRRELDKRASEVESGMRKEAFAAAIGRAIGSGLGHAAGAPIRAAKAVVQGGASTAKKAGIGTGGAASASAGLAFDAAMYSPGVNKVTGRSKDVWSSLQSH